MKVYVAIAYPAVEGACCNGPEKLFFKKEDAEQYMETQNKIDGWNRVICIEEMIVE